MSNFSNNELKNELLNIRMQIEKICEKEGVRDALLQSATLGVASGRYAFDIAKIHKLMHRMEEITGYTLHELFDEHKLEEIISS